MIIKSFRKFNESVDDIKEVVYVFVPSYTPRDGVILSCIEAIDNDIIPKEAVRDINGKIIEKEITNVVGRVQFLYDKSQKVPYHDNVEVVKGYKRNNIGFKLKMMAIGLNENSKYYTSGLTEEGKSFIDRWAKEGYWTKRVYKGKATITLTENGEILSKAYCKKYLKLIKMADDVVKVFDIDIKFKD